MLYNLHINQLAFSQYEKLDYRHCIVFDATHKIFTTFNKIEKIYEENQTWYWLSYDLLLSQIPLLKIGKDQLRILLKDLALYNLISINPNNQKHARTYFCLGSNAESIFRPLEKIQDPSEINSIPPLEKISEYNKQDIINNKNLKKEKFSAENYVQSLDLNLDLKNILLSWLEIRKTKKTATTQKSIDLALKTLNQFDLQTQIKMVENSILNGWTGIFEIKQPIGKYSDQEKTYQQNLALLQAQKEAEKQAYDTLPQIEPEIDYEAQEKARLQKQLIDQEVQKIKEKLDNKTFDFSQLKTNILFMLKKFPDNYAKAQIIYGNLNLK